MRLGENVRSLSLRRRVRAEEARLMSFRVETGRGVCLVSYMNSPPFVTSRSLGPHKKVLRPEHTWFRLSAVLADSRDDSLRLPSRNLG